MYPLYSEKDMNDGVKFGYELHRKMIENITVISKDQVTRPYKKLR